LLRNPLAVISSILETWVKSDWDRLSMHRDDILRAPGLLATALNELGDKAEIIRYEEFVQNPQEQLKTLCKKLEIPFEPSMINYGDNLVPKGRMGDAVGVKKHNKPEVESPEKGKKTFVKPIKKMLAEVCLTLLGPEVIKRMGYDYNNLLGSLLQVSINEPYAEIDEIKKVLSALSLSSKSLDIIDPLILKYIKVEPIQSVNSIAVTDTSIPVIGSNIQQNRVQARIPSLIITLKLAIRKNILALNPPFP